MRSVCAKKGERSGVMGESENQSLENDKGRVAMILCIPVTESFERADGYLAERSRDVKNRCG